ncbi:tyrosine-type recombinase/integrase [Streptomyces sp. NPDC008317]|uniref:site-specific integrase n=1 Tax=Streptomyces sp. NPDC008317 TaxID=3364827 RepID=UPI0036E653BF
MLLELALHTGLRKGELLGLRWEDLDLAGGTASIRRTLQRTNSDGLTALPTKTQSSERRIALPTPCLCSLEQHRDRQLQEREAGGTGWKDSGYVFTRPDGAPVEGSTLTRHLNTLLRQARLRRIRFHGLRHSTAILLLEQGMELVVIKELLGHAPVWGHRHRLRPRPTPPPTRRHRPPRPRPPPLRREHQQARRRRRPTALRSTRPLTLPSTTAVRHRCGPVGTLPTGPHICSCMQARCEDQVFRLRPGITHHSTPQSLLRACRSLASP